MPLRCILSFLLLAGLIAPVHAQNAPVESASKEMIADALQALNLLVVRQGGGDIFHFDLNNRPVTLERLVDGRRLLLKAATKKQPSLAALNAYNEKVAITTRAVRYEKLGVLLESGLDCELGITPAGLKKFVSRFASEMTAFEKFLDNQPAGAQDIVPVNAGRKKVPLAIDPKSGNKEFVITFPTSDPANWETAWKITWDMETAREANTQGFSFPVKRQAQTVLFKIKKAFFKPGRNQDWIQVLDDAHPSEFYVPYYFRSTRFFDVKDHGHYIDLSANEGGQQSQLLGSKVMAELRDRGITYKLGGWSRRGEELTLWADFQAVNYAYLVEFGFHDDGTIAFRHAPTGYNFPNHPEVPHMHNSYWRIGLKLGPEENNARNQVHVVRLPTTPQDQASLKGKIQSQQMTKEGFVDWSPQEFLRMRVTNPDYFTTPFLKSKNLPISYDLVTSVQGIARHRLLNEKFSLHDFWVTRHDCKVKMYPDLGNHLEGRPEDQRAELNDENVVLWHSSSALHIPRAEDGILQKGSSAANGQAVVTWTTFELRPRNLFEKTPIYRRSQ